MKQKIKQSVKEYYSKKISLYGTTALGVDWNSKDSQYLRFEKLFQFFTFETNQSILDFGCGYGELVSFIDMNYGEKNLNYYGYDITPNMIEAAKLKFESSTSIVFSESLPSFNYDFVFASGVFNVKPNKESDKEWLEYIIKTIHEINDLAENGFSFNCLTSYSDKEYMKDNLYYAEPLFLFDYCKNNFSKKINLIHDYDLYEFTIIVKK